MIRSRRPREAGRAVVHLLLWTSIAAVIGFVLWAQWARLDQITRASGQVITYSRNQVIQAPPAGGVVEAILVREGSTVERGQVLVRFERPKLQASVDEVASRAAALRAAIARLEAEVFGRGGPTFPAELAAWPQFRENQLALFQRRRQLLAEELGSLDRLRELAQQELDLNLPLLASGDVSRAEILRLQRQVADLAGQIVNRRNRFMQDSQAELGKAQEDLAGVMQMIAQRREELDLTEVRAPMDGVVRNVRVTTRGAVARPGDELMQIVPAGEDLIVEAKVRPADIGFLRRGLPATVKLDAFDYAVYGSLAGETVFISADTLTEQVGGQEVPYYRVHVRTREAALRSPRGGLIELQPGMTATVEIRTGERTVWRYLTRPITRTLDESLRER
jgi:adhesin transport system membrane fusion protein